MNVEKSWQERLGPERWAEDPRALVEDLIEQQGVGREWLERFGAGDTPAALAGALRVARDDFRFRAAMDLGMSVGRIVRCENARWRTARAEQSERALIIPVQAGERDELGLTLSLSELGAAGAVLNVVDLIALPLDSSRPLSFNGAIAAVGCFAIDTGGEALLFAGWQAWLDAHFAEPDYPPHVISTLIVNPSGIEWRPTRLSCAVPRAVKTIRVVDSRGLAELIHSSMRKKDPAPKWPEVIGPRVNA